MRTLRELFIDVVSTEFTRRKQVHDDRSLLSLFAVEGLPEDVREALGEMKLLRSQEGYFSHLGYSRAVLQVIENTPDSQRALRLLLRYCYFEMTVGMLPYLPHVVYHLHLAELHEWAKLQVDRLTMRPLVERVFQGLAKSSLPERITTREAATEAELAIFGEDLFHIPRPKRLEGVVEWYRTGASPNDIETILR